MTELNNFLISIIESQISTIQLFLNNLKRHSHSIPDKEIQEKINNNEIHNEEMHKLFPNQQTEPLGKEDEVEVPIVDNSLL